MVAGSRTSLIYPGFLRMAVLPAKPRRKHKRLPFGCSRNASKTAKPVPNLSVYLLLPYE